MHFCARIKGQIGTGSAPFLIGSLAARYGRHKRLCSGQVGRPQCHSYANAVFLLSALQIPWFAFLWSPVSIKTGKNTFFIIFFFSLSEVLKDGLHLFLHADNSQEMNISMSEDEMTSEYILFVVVVAVKLMVNPHDPVVGARTNGEERHFIPSQ